MFSSQRYLFVGLLVIASVAVASAQFQGIRANGACGPSEDAACGAAPCILVRLPTLYNLTVAVCEEALNANTGLVPNPDAFAVAYANTLMEFASLSPPPLLPEMFAVTFG